MSNFKIGQEIIAEYVKALPDKPGVYQMRDADDKILYVGKAKRIKKRVSNYTSQNRLTHRIQRMVAQTRSMQFIYTHTETEALLLESNLIKKHLPPFNILLRDDKSFPYIEITDDAFALMKKFRGHKQKNRDYFGPFPSSDVIDRTIVSLQKAFKLRNCSNAMFASRKRPCLQYQIQRCTAPCVGKVSEAEYAKQKADAIDFLKGKTQNVQKNLADQMRAASDAHHFERAAALRDRIKALSSVQFKQDIHLDHVKNADFIAAYQIGEDTAIAVFFYRNGSYYGNKIYYPKYTSEIDVGEILNAFMGQFYTNHDPPAEIYISHEMSESDFFTDVLSELSDQKITLISPQRGQKKQVIDHCLLQAKNAMEKKLLERKSQQAQLTSLVDKLSLTRFPNRIEIYDNSHLFGQYAYGAMVVFGKEGFDKAAYRTYKIKSDAINGDDYGMMREVLSRRLKNAGEDADEILPDLILLDGGRGQLNIVHQILVEKNLVDKIDLVAISKGPNRNAGEEDFHKIGVESFSFAKQDQALFLLQRLRDEAHRFGITTHRKSRAKAIPKSALDQIDGIGPKRKKALLNHFGSIKTLSQAGIEDIKSVDGINHALAAQIYYHFHEQ